MSPSHPRVDMCVLFCGLIRRGKISSLLRETLTNKNNNKGRRKRRRRSLIMSSRRKNPHPQRAVNVKTVLKVEKEEPVLLCLRIPDEEDGDDVDFDEVVEQQNEIRKEKTATKEGRERERNTSAMFARRFLIVHQVWSNTSVFTRKRNRMNAMCARSVLLNLVI